MEGNHRDRGRPLYRPYRWAAADFQVGLRPMKPDQWILVDSGHADVMREKRARLAAFPGLYYRTLQSSLAAQYELRERVVAHLTADHPAHFERTGTWVRSRRTGVECDLTDPSIEPLLQLSSLIEEDFMLIEEVEGLPRITAASNAYSSSGRLVASVGRDIEWAHRPVPDLTRKLGPRIDRVLSSVHTTTPCERFNWQLTPMATVFFPHDDPHAANAAAMHGIRESLRKYPDRAGDLLWVRVERQTLCRLPESRAVAFSLHTYSDPLSSLRADVESVRAMLALLRGYSEERWKYSEMDIVREPVIRWLESAANEAGANEADANEPV
jgi:hypothetical protein